MILPAEIVEYQTYLKLNYKSVKSNHKKVEQLFTYCHDNGLDFRVLQARDLDNYLLYVKPYSNQVHNSYIGALKNFYNFLFDREYCGDKTYRAITKLRTKKFAKRAGDWITRPELDIIVKYASTFQEQHDAFKIKVIFYFLFYTGLRLGEFLNLKRSDFFLEKKQGYFIVTDTKNQIIEKTLLNPKFLITMLIEFFEKTPEEQNAFNITLDEVKALFKKLREWKVLDDKYITPHAMRRSYGHYLKKCGVPFPEIMALMRHKNSNSTMIYTLPTEEEKREALRRVK